jgi:hypothetical protein
MLPSYVKRCHFVIAPKLPNGFKKLCIGRIPQPAAMQVGTYFPDGGDQLAGAHFWDSFRKLVKGFQQFDSRIGMTHNWSFTKSELDRRRRYRPITIT